MLQVFSLPGSGLSPLGNMVLIGRIVINASVLLTQKSHAIYLEN